MSLFKQASAALVLACAVATATAAPAVISSYDITGTQPSGTGGWSHSYTGTMLGNTYTGGSGTLNDGLAPGSEQNNHLFFFSDNPVITLHLAESTKVNSIDILGGLLSGNAIPGTLNGWSVTIGGQAVSLTSVGFSPSCASGPCDDRVSLIGTGLEFIATQTIVLSQFTGIGGQWPNHFSASEIVVNGTTAVPEPEAFAMVASGLALMALARARQQRRRQG